MRRDVQSNLQLGRKCTRPKYHKEPTDIRHMSHMFVFKIDDESCKVAINVQRLVTKQHCRMGVCVYVLRFYVWFPT